MCNLYFYICGYIIYLFTRLTLNIFSLNLFSTGTAGSRFDIFPPCNHIRTTLWMICVIIPTCEACLRNCGMKWKSNPHYSTTLQYEYILHDLTLSWRRPLSYRNQSIDLPSKSMEWFLYDNDLRHERVNFWQNFFPDPSIFA